MFLALSLQQLGDSKGLTAYQQLIGAAVALLTVVGLLLLRVTDTLSFYTFVWLSLAGAGLNCAVLGYRLLVVNRTLFWNGVITVRNYGARWWRFTKPLIALQYYLPLVSYLGLFLIQKWYGSEEQGYYALALQWCAFAMVFTNSGIWIFWRKSPITPRRRICASQPASTNNSAGYFFFWRWFCHSGFPQAAGSPVQVVAGERFRAAAGVLAIMAFYPVSQTLSQLTWSSESHGAYR